MLSKKRDILFILCWLIFQSIWAFELFPFALNLFNIKFVSSLPELLKYSQINTMTRLVVNSLDQYNLFTIILRSIKPLEVFSLILDLMLMVGLVEDKSIIKDAKTQLFLGLGIQIISFIIFSGLLKTQNVSGALFSLRSLGLLLIIWCILRVLIVLKSLIHVWVNSQTY